MNVNVEKLENSQIKLTITVEAEKFEEEHLDEITEHMRELADELMVEPRKLLSHVLDYRIFAEKL